MEEGHTDLFIPKCGGVDARVHLECCDQCMATNRCLHSHKIRRARLFTIFMLFEKQRCKGLIFRAFLNSFLLLRSYIHSTTVKPRLTSYKLRLFEGFSTTVNFFKGITAQFFEDMNHTSRNHSLFLDRLVDYRASGASRDSCFTKSVSP